MRLLARQLYLLSLVTAAAVLYCRTLPHGPRVPGAARPRLWQIWPDLHNAQMPCWLCKRPRWAEDLVVERLLWGGYVAVCDECLAKGSPHGIPA